MTLVDWAEMSATFESETGHDLDWFFGSGVDLANGTKLGTDQEFGWTGIDIEGDNGTSADGLTFLATLSVKVWWLS